MPDEDKTYNGSLGLELLIWRHVHTLLNFPAEGNFYMSKCGQLEVSFVTPPQAARAKGFDKVLTTENLRLA